MKTCTECNGKIIGRSDKKFCSDECRVNYHNNRNRDSNKLIRNINRILRKNRRILFELNPNGNSKITQKDLVEQGFNFKYFTTWFKTGKGKVYFYCYDQAYHLLEDSKIELLNK